MNKFWIFLLIVATTLNAQQDLLQSGPMVGYSAYREALIWVQTTQPAQVKIGYYKEGEQEVFTPTVTTSIEDDFIAKLYPRQVEFGTQYTYKLYINNVHVPRDYKLSFKTQALWQYRTEPPNFSFAIGSCAFINEKKDDRPSPYGGGYEIFNSILAKQPDFMLWTGDNTYLRTPDFMTETGIRHRHRHTRSTPELQPLLGSVHHYATWDDHDYGPNNADRSYVNKHIAEKAFNDYWGNLNTNAAGNGGVAQHFSWADVEVFMLDNRYHRAPNDSREKNKAYFGMEQVNWLIDALQNSRAPFKIIVSGGQVVSDAAKFENYATYPEERDYLFKRLHEERISGVLFISGDRHHTEISRLERENAYPLIDITCSPLTSGTHAARDEGNTLQVKDKTFYEKNFGIVEVSGPRKERKLVLTIYDQKGKKVFDYSITAKELRY
ncbi:phosphodiesterase [Nonlabens sp. MIC269]|uniref:alkaline phosphatase D family protein n=1 Tax=Nonlabens sp. MIC269 TaxID=1476901 RepID=UPI00071FB8F1|nr:alkaline phosphatase D family protein [Nonlabens sp. MIC269]ALM20895.1 phosphodiesterase [Nonlabens sp. MIC269]